MADTNPVVSALAEYIEQRDFALVAQIQNDVMMTSSEVTVQPGVKSKSDLHFLETSVNFLAGAGCDRGTPTDVTTFTNKTIEVKSIDIVENLCLKKLEGKWAQIEMKVGSTVGVQEIPAAIAKVYWEEKTALMMQALDTADWQGDTASVVANLNKYDGWIKVIDAGSAVAGNTLGLTSIDETNIIAAIQAMVKVIPARIRRKPGLKLWLSEEWYDLYCLALINSNKFHFAGSDSEETLFGFKSIGIRPTYGLNGSDRMFITYASNLVLGVDGEGDTEFTSRLDPSTLKRIFIDASFKRGTQVFFTEDVVEFTLAVS
ncbi:MAG: hypothetical protein ACRCYO_13365 [Bacteroidia bacterium]